MGNINDNNMEPHEYEYQKAANYNAPEMRARAVHMVLDQQKTVQEAHDWFGMCNKSITEYCKRREETGNIYTEEEIEKENDKHYKRKNKRHKITPFCGVLIHTIIDLTKEITLQKLREELLGFGFDISISGLHYYLQDENLTLKVITRMAHESDLECREIFWSEFYTYCTDYKQLMFIDETWRNDKTVNPKRGRSKRGTRCKVHVHLTRGNYKLNLLLACNYTGPICYDIYEDAVNAETFYNFLLERLSELTNPYPGENSILILDNHYSHESVAVMEWCNAMNVIPIFEPSHDPNVNMTEWCFNAIKMKEKAKGISGNIDEARLSLCDSIYDLQGSNWKSVLSEIGYIDAVTDSD